MNNTKLKVDTLREIDITLLKTAIQVACGGGITSVAPLGFSGDTIIIFENKNKVGNRRSSEVSIRMHSGNVEMLITDSDGSFLFHGMYCIGFGIDFLSKQYYQSFNKCKKYILKEKPDLCTVNRKESNTCNKSIAFLLSKQ